MWVVLPGVSPCAIRPAGRLVYASLVPTGEPVEEPEWVDVPWEHSALVALQGLVVDPYEPEFWHLLGPDGEVLRTFSDRPSFGFHQGERGLDRP